MFSEVINKTFDWLVVFVLSSLVIWFGVTQPVISFMGERKVSEIDQDRLKQHVAELSQTFAPRTSEFDGIRPAAHYIFRELSSAGSLSGNKPKYQAFWTMAGRFSNIIYSIGPATAETLVIGAHYDTRNVVPGADNNASGVAVLIELARALSVIDKDLPIRVELVAYALSEGSTLGVSDMGSFKHAEMLKKKNRTVKLMISVDSVGYFSSEPNSQAYPFSFMKMIYPTVGNFINIAGHMQDFMEVRHVKKSFERASSLDVRSINAPENFPGIAGSDHVSYWEHGVAAVLISDTSYYRNKNHNTVNDTAEKLNYVGMSMVAQGLYQTVMDFQKSDKQSDQIESGHNKLQIINPKN